MDLLLACLHTWFWAKIATFVVIALLSIPPTIALIRRTERSKRTYCSGVGLARLALDRV
jgi:uncharacterized membrane protein